MNFPEMFRHRCFSVAPETQPTGSQVPQSTGSQVSAVHGFTGSAVHGFTGSAVHGFRGSAVRGFTGSAVHGFTGSAVHGFTGSANTCAAAPPRDRRIFSAARARRFLFRQELPRAPGLEFFYGQGFIWRSFFPPGPAGGTQRVLFRV